MPEITLRRRGEIVRGVFEVLLDEPEGIPPIEVIERVRELVPPTAFERSDWPNHPGQDRYPKYVRFHTISAVKAGWLVKDTDHGVWRLTDAGRKAFLDHVDPEDFQRVAETAYRAWSAEQGSTKAKNAKWVLVDKALAALPPGRWTTYGDLAEFVQSSAQAIGNYIMSNPVPNAHRVLQSSGSVAPGFRWADPTRTDSAQQALLDSGVLLDESGRADPAQRLTALDLQELVGVEITGRRAWLVRGSSVLGRNLIPTWLQEGICSLAASHLPPVESGMTREELKPLVDDAYAHVSYNARDEKLNEFHAFLTRMQIGDLVATTSQGLLYVGVIAGDAAYEPTQDGRSNLRRAVDWLADAPVDYADLPDPLPARLQTQHDVLDLTQQLPLLEQMLGQRPDVDRVPRGFRLPDASDELAQRLLVTSEWLQLCIDLVRDRPQLIFYGPPGTGKTYLAQHLAWHLAGRDNTKLVQFHPAYSYEDFFEGYRPEAGEGGTVAFRLTPGPFRRLVDQAREHPDQAFVLIIDEINRGNLAKIFGELYFLLEYRDQAIDLLYSSGDEQGFTLPKNVLLIGTMNTADRSIALVDAAMRRRFAFVPLHPDEPPTRDMLRRWLIEHELPDTTARLLDELNSRIDDPDFKIGPSYIMRDSVHQQGGLERVWRTAILPLLEEHHYGDGIDVRKRYGLAALERAIHLDAPSAEANPETQSGDSA